MPGDGLNSQTRAIAPAALVTGAVAAVVMSAIGMAACTVYCLVDWIVR
jgi:hypothetical protein